jgi:hypothetical protein
MTLIKCRECEAQVSSDAKTCPKCGAPVPHPKLWPWVVGIPVILFAAFILYGMSIPEYEAQARRVRDVCEKLAAPGQQIICDEQFDEAIARGRGDSGDRQ